MTTSEKSSDITGVRLAPKLEDALESIIEDRHLHSPLLPRPTKSDVLRALIAEEYQRINSGPTCPACDGQTFAKDGVWYCRECGLKVALED